MILFSLSLSERLEKNILFQLFQVCEKNEFTTCADSHTCSAQTVS